MIKSFKKMLDSQRFTLTRLEAFSDGVFAIVITLLVLELRVPQAHNSQQLLEGLRDLWPKFLSFTVSFLYITIYWINHHQLFHLIKDANKGLFWTNSLFLLCLTFIPFPTAMIGSYPSDPVAVIFYGLAMMACAVSFVLMKCYAFYIEPLTEYKAGKPEAFYLIAGPLLYLIAVLLALVNTVYAILIYLLIPVLYFFVEGIDKKE